MAFLALNAVTIPVRILPVDAEVEQFGDEASAHDGTPLARIRSRKRTWEMETPWLTSAQATIVRAQLVSTAPAAATGDLTGAVSVIPRLLSERTGTFAGSERRVSYVFQLLEV